MTVQEAMMTTTAFDTLAYSKKLIKLGFTQEQAEGFAELARQKDDADKSAYEALRAAMQDKLDAKDEALRRELATKADLQSEVRATELRLQSEIRATELRLLKWQFGIGLALAVIMAKGFGWLGF